MGTFFLCIHIINMADNGKYKLLKSVDNILRRNGHEKTIGKLRRIRTMLEVINDTEVIEIADAFIVYIEELKAAGEDHFPSDIFDEMIITKSDGTLMIKVQTREERIRRIMENGDLSTDAFEALKIAQSLFLGKGSTRIIASALYTIGKADARAEMRAMIRSKKDEGMSNKTAQSLNPETTTGIEAIVYFWRRLMKLFGNQGLSQQLQRQNIFIRLKLRSLEAGY